MDSTRLEAFSDGVFAVAITVLALGLAVPVPGQGHEPIFTQLGSHWPSFAAFAVSFATIGIIWVNHHTLFKNFARIDRTLLFINLLLLFFVVTIPFATATMASYLRSGDSGATEAAVIYQGVFEGMGLAFGGLFWWSVKKDHLKVAFSPAAGRAAVIRFGAGNVAYLAAIAVAFASAPASLLVSGLVAVYYIFEHTPARPQEGQGDSGGPGDPGSPEERADQKNTTG